MALDYLTVIRDHGARAVAALEADRGAAIPWSDSWTVQDCALHLGGVHHGVSAVVRGRPTADFAGNAAMERPDASDPELARWIADGTVSLLEALESVGDDVACWSWWPMGGNGAFWKRRMAQETVVHRWDVEYGARLEIAPLDPALAADGVDEFLEIFAAVGRLVHSGPGAGESVHVHCDDADGEWLITFPSLGQQTLERTHAKGDVAFRGPAEGLLLFLWGRVTPEAAGVSVLGDDAVAARWRQLVPAF